MTCSGSRSGTVELAARGGGRGRPLDSSPGWRPSIKEQGNAWCKKQGIDFWNYPDTGWNTQLPGSTTLIWQQLVALAYANRVDLTCSFTAPIRGGEAPVPVFTYKDEGSQPSLPGVVPGGMQGVGYLLTEKLVFEEGDDNPNVGRLNSVNTWSYKPPAATSVPLDFNVYLFPRCQVAPYVPDDSNEVFSAKEVGEPPLVLANSVFFAVKDAVRASRVERGLSAQFRMDAPATVEEVRLACEVRAGDLTGQPT